MKGNLPKSLRWLLASRMVIATFLLGIAAFIEYRGVEIFLNRSLRVVYILLSIAYLTSILIIFILKRYPHPERSVFALSMVDLVLITLLVHYTGGADSIYSILYPLVVIYAALLVGKKSGHAVAGIGGLLYGLLLGLEYSGMIASFDSYIDYRLSSRQILAKFLIHIISLFVISVLSSFVSEQEKKMRALLTEREDAFKELNLLHRHIIESVDAGILTFDMNGRIKSFNRAASDITGRSEMEMLDRNIRDVFPGLDSTRKPIPKTRIHRSEIDIPGREDLKTIIGFSISPLMNHKGEQIGEIMIFQDVTAIREMERQLEKNRKMALIGEMAAGLAHEMRNPLAAMGGSIQVLRSGLKLNRTDERLMQIILRGKDQLDVFLRDFLMLARPAASAHEEINIAAMIDDILETIRYGQDWREHIDIVRPAPIADCLMCGNKSEIHQALMNVIINAIQAMPEGGRLTIEQSTKILNGKAFLNIAVQDTGCGIDQDMHGKIFEPFHTTKDRGTGLGLAIVNRVVESHCGKVAVTSRTGEGTKIELCFPMRNDIKASISLQQEPDFVSSAE